MAHVPLSVPGDTPVLRAGLMSDRRAVQESALDAEAHPQVGIHGLSVEFFVGEDDVGALRSSRRPNRQVRLSTVGRIRAGGFELYRTLGPNHATLEVGKPLTDEEFAALQLVFDPPIVNDYRQRRGP